MTIQSAKLYQSNVTSLADERSAAVKL